jgi:hypothetical protein
MRVAKPFLLASLVVLLGACDLFTAAPSADSRVASFTLPAAANPVLAADVKGLVDEKTKTITLMIDPAVTDFSALKPTIVIAGSGSIYPSSGVAKDFTQTPATYKLVETNGKTSVYFVTIIPKSVDAEPGAVRITEYFCGTGGGTATTGELNRYLEFYNGSSAAVDLSQFELAQRRAKAGRPDSSLDQVVRLKGSIPANSFFILYSARMNVALLSVAFACPNKQSDGAYNGIMDSDGASSYQLMKEGVVIDTVGPMDGSAYAGETCFFRRSDTASGIPGPAAPLWDRSAWARAPASGLLGDDVNAGKASLRDSSLVSLLVTSGLLKIPATINATAGTATILLPDGVDAANLLLSVGSFGSSASIDGTTITSAKTGLDLSSGKKTLTIAGQDGTNSNYVISAIPRYTTTNYDFDGGIKAVVDKIVAGGTADTPLGDVFITGVITAKNIYPASFFIQDMNAGIYFYTSEGISFPVGSKVKILVSTGKVYYGMPEVTVYDSAIDPVSTDLFSLYYKTGDYAAATGIGSVYRYDGSIAQGGLSYYKGQFAGALYFHYPIDIQTALAAGATGTFYGPVSYTRENYTMELVTRDQFSLH